MVRAGRFRHFVEVQEETTTEDGFGEPIVTWVKRADVWGIFEPLRGTERWAARQAQSEVEYRFRTRWRDDIEVTDRLVWDGRTFTIDAMMEPDGRQRELHLLVVEIQ